jgi:hypothetical protein
VRRKGGLAAGIDRIVTIDTSLARWSMTMQDVSSMAGAAIPVFVAAIEASDLPSSAQQAEGDASGAQHGALAFSASGSCFAV